MLMYRLKSTTQTILERIVDTLANAALKPLPRSPVSVLDDVMLLLRLYTPSTLIGEGEERIETRGDIK